MAASSSLSHGLVSNVLQAPRSSERSLLWKGHHLAPNEVRRKPHGTSLECEHKNGVTLLFSWLFSVCVFFSCSSN